MFRRLLRAFHRPAPAPDAQLARGVDLLEQNDIDGARRIAAALARAAGALAYAHFLEALIAERQGNPAAALRRADAAIESNPAEPVYWLKAASLCFALGDYERSAELYERLLALENQPYRDDPLVLFAAAGALERSLRSDRAVQLLERAVEIKPDFETARRNLATLLALEGRTERARSQMDLLLRDVLLRSAPSAAERLKKALMLPPICHSNAEIEAVRKALSDELDALLEDPRLDLGDPVRDVGLTAFALAYHGRNDVELMTRLGRVVRRGYRDARVSCEARAGSTARRRSGKIRIGFVSTYFRNHSVARTTHGLIQDLPRDRFEVHVFAIAPGADAWAAAIRDSADRYLALPNDLNRAREAIEASALDMLLFADIGMHPTTYFLAFWRLAPIQLTTWGHPVTSGIDTVDYYVSSEMLEDAESAGHYSEQLIRLPGYFMPRYRRPALSGPRGSRAELGLSTDSHVYFCTQTIIKLHPDYDAALRAILERDPAAEILLMESAPYLGQQIRARLAASLGALAGRVRFLPHMLNERFLQFVAAADVVLDTFHFGGCNSSCEALSLATPIATLPGRMLGGRFTLGHYRELDIEGCIAGSVEQFVDIAVRLGTDRDFRGHVSAQLAERSARLFDRPDTALALGAELERIAQTRL